jgi:hypothetical protein
MSDKHDELLRESIDEALDEAQINTDDRKEQILPEAPASVTIKVWIKGYGVMLTARDNRVSELLKKTETLIDYAESHKWKNVWDQPGTVQPVQKVIPSDTPICEIHGTPMKHLEGISKKTGKAYSFWSCQEKMDDGSWCKGNAKKV